MRQWARITFKKGTENSVEGDNSSWHTVDREQQLRVERMNEATQICYHAESTYTCAFVSEA